VDQYLLADLPEGGRLAHAAIVGPDSGVWASDPTFPALSQAEAAKLASLLKTAAAATVPATVPAGSSAGASSSTKQQQVTDTLSIGGKVYEARLTPAAAAAGGGGGAGEGIPGGVLLVCRSKGGLMGLGGGKEGAVVAATGRALVMGLWDDRRAEAGCSSAVQRLAQALLSYGY
jgi:hypothetical protein